MFNFLIKYLKYLNLVLTLLFRFIIFPLITEYIEIYHNLSNEGYHNGKAAYVLPQLLFSRARLK